MKDVLRRMEWYELFDYAGVERHLSRMAAKGWRLESAGRYLWRYRRAEPARLTYAVTYAEDASLFQPEPTRGQRNLEELCAQCGWEKAAEWHQMQIFCTQQESPVPLETDERVRLAVLRRAMRRSFLPARLALLALIFLYLARLAFLLRTSPVEFLSRSSLLAAAAALPLCLALALVSPCAYWLWSFRSGRSVRRGGPCAPCGPWYRRCTAALSALAAALLPVLVLAGSPGEQAYLAAHLGIFLLILFLIIQVSGLLKREGIPRGANLFFTLAADVLLCCALFGLLRFAAAQGAFALPAGGEAAPPLLRAEQAVSLPQGQEYVQERSAFRSPLMSLERGSETARFPPQPGSLERLWYKAWQSPYPSLLDWANRRLRENESSESSAYLPEDPSPWGAEEAYRFWQAGTPQNLWLLRRGNQAALVRFAWYETAGAGWEPAPAQKEIIGKQLLGG